MSLFITPNYIFKVETDNFIRKSMDSYSKIRDREGLRRISENIKLKWSCKTPQILSKLKLQLACLWHHRLSLYKILKVSLCSKQLMSVTCGGFLPEIMLKVALNTKTQTQNSWRVRYYKNIYYISLSAKIIPLFFLLQG